MPCYGPLFGYYSKELNATGKRSITFDRRNSFSGIRILIPCGECIGCRLKWRREWAIRCIHEKRLHTASAFLTLTYDDAHLPSPPSLNIRHLQLFMKRLRKVRASGLRFFACGEYGDTSLRPHYHVLLFNTDFPDQRFLKNSDTGERLYRSAELRELWSFGDHYIGSVSARSCSYVAGYITKKVGQPSVVHPGFESEFRVMSRRPGIGAVWFERYCAEAYKHDSAIIEGREVGLPRFYDTKFAKLQAEALAELKRARKRKALFTNPEDRTKARLLVREQVELLTAKRFERGN